LSACAGIAYCHEKFPFHYAVELAEALCSRAKKASKAIDGEHPPSSLMFHNVQSSHYESFDDYRKRELTLRTDKGEINLDFGPYFLEKQNDYARIADFRKAVSAFMGENTPIGKLRNWLDLLEESEDLAAQALKRIHEMADERGFDAGSLTALGTGLDLERLIVERDGKRTTPVYDILQIHAISGAVQ